LRNVIDGLLEFAFDRVVDLLLTMGTLEIDERGLKPTLSMQSTLLKCPAVTWGVNMRG
jgi:hypothetical protein